MKFRKGPKQPMPDITPVGEYNPEDVLDLPTPRCNPHTHKVLGGGCLHCCDRCNFDLHLCPGCGCSIRHDQVVCGECVELLHPGT